MGEAASQRGYRVLTIETCTAAQAAHPYKNIREGRSAAVGLISDCPTDLSPVLLDSKVLSSPDVISAQFDTAPISSGFAHSSAGLGLEPPREKPVANGPPAVESVRQRGHPGGTASRARSRDALAGGIVAEPGLGNGRAHVQRRLCPTSHPNLAPCPLQRDGRRAQPCFLLAVTDRFARWMAAGLSAFSPSPANASKSRRGMHPDKMPRLNPRPGLHPPSPHQTKRHRVERSSRQPEGHASPLTPDVPINFR
jgi:hypothetical protein